MGSIGVSNSFLLDGSLTLSVGWTPSEEDGDLVVLLGAVSERVGQIFGSISPSINSSADELVGIVEQNLNFHDQLRALIG